MARSPETRVFLNFNLRTDEMKLTHEGYRTELKDQV